MATNDVNFKIQCLQKRIEENEMIQSRWQAAHGEMHMGIYQKHEEMCDQMDELCRLRRQAG